MSLVEWNDRLLLGIQQIDEDHMHLFSLLKRASDSLENQATVETVDHLLKELTDYAKYHFSAEEKLMEKYNYPLVDGHKAEHSEFISKLSDLISEKDFICAVMHNPEEQHGMHYSLLNVISFLNNWLISHIVRSDTKYAKFIKDTLPSSAA